MQDTSDKSATRATRARYKWHMSDASATRVRHECDTSATRMTRDPYIYYMASERLQGEKQFHSKNYLLEMPCSHAKMHLKSAPQKLNFLMEKATSKSCSLDCSCKCPCTFPHSYVQ